MKRTGQQQQQQQQQQHLVMLSWNLMSSISECGTSFYKPEASFEDVLRHWSEA